MAGPGARPDGTAFYSDIIGGAAEMANVHPVTDFPTTADYSVTSLSGLNTALASASAGDTIELAPGNYGDWTPSKLNPCTDANFDTNKIRIFCREWWGENQGTAGAKFTSIELDNSPGCTGLSIENVYISGNFRAEGANCGHIDLVGSFGTYYRLTYSTDRMRAMHCVFDHAFARSDGNGPTCQMNFLDTDVYLQNIIFCRAGGDNVQVQQTDTNGKVYIHDFAIWDQFVDNVVAHPDLLQSVNGRAFDVRRGILWQEPGIANNKGAQGVALGDGAHVDTVVENVFVRCDQLRKISCTSLTGTISNCCTVGNIIVSERGGSPSAATVDNCVSSDVVDEDGDGVFVVDPDLPAQNNTQYGAASADTVFQNNSGDYRDWRDFLPVTTRDNGGITYLQSLVSLWDESPSIPKNIARRVNLNVSVA